MRKQLAMSCEMTMLVTPKRCARLLDEVVDHAAGERIEAARRLVVDEDGRLEHQRAREADALAHAARELGRELRAATLSSRPRIVELVQHLRAALGGRELRVLDEREGDVVEHVDRVEERRVLVDHPELLPHPVELALAHGDDVLAVDEDLRRSSACSSATMRRRSVVLPAPEPPTMHVVSLRRHTMSIPWRTSVSPKRLS